MKKRFFLKRVLSSIMIAVMGFAMLGGDIRNIFASSLSEAQEEKKELEKALKQAQSMIDELETSQGDVEESIKNLNSQLVEISAQITSLENDLAEKSNSIISTQEELQAAQEAAATQYEDMKVRIQFMYENSTDSYLEMLLSSKSISEFLNAAEYIAEIETYDRKKLTEYEETVAYISDTEALLQQEYAELEEMKEDVERQKQAVAALMEQKEVQLAGIESDLSSAMSDADYFAAEIQAQDEMIAEIQAAEAAKIAAEQAAAAQQAANAGNTENGSGDGNSADGGSTSESGGSGGESAPEYTGGVFTWPCPSSYRITSDYGPRTSPTAGASSNHKGIDIGAAYGADIVAAADGRVVTASYSSSAGNYVMIDHGNGLYTVYMHASSLCVSSGQNVSAGDVVAKVGSTGVSTGNHLHFGVSLNGSYVSPWNYLSRP